MEGLQQPKILKQSLGEHFPARGICYLLASNPSPCKIRSLSPGLSPAQALTAQVPPVLKKHETKQLSPSPLVSWYLVCEGISLLQFLYVYVDNEDIYNYVNGKKAARDQAV